jgi:hypothetical protein
MKRPHNFSVSQVDTFLDCNRKWFFGWPMDRKQPTTDAQARGTYIHKSIAEWITDKVPPPVEHTIYLRALEAHFPKHDFSVEHKLVLDTHLGIPWIGYIDLICEDPGVTVLVDWKTTSDLRYAKTPAELMSNLQLGVYAHYAYELGVESDVRAGLVYVEVPKTPPKKVKVLPVFVDLPRDHVRGIWESTKPVIERMLAASELDDPNDIEPNTACCSKYGGCPYRIECGLSLFKGVASHPTKKTKENQVSFLDKLKKNGQTDAPPAAAVIPSVTAKKVAAAPAATAAPAAPKMDFLGKKSAPAAGALPAIISPDAPPRDVMPEEPKVAKAAPVTVEDEDAMVVEAAVPEAKRRGRPKGSVEKKGLIIYVDCMVTKGGGDVEATTLEDFWGPIDMELNQAAAEAGKATWWDFSFSEQKGAIAIKVQERIQKGLPHAIVAMRSSNFLMSDVLPLLIPHAVQVVRRF